MISTPYNRQSPAGKTYGVKMLTFGVGESIINQLVCSIKQSLCVVA
jgi:hypothetical protein